MAVDMTTRRGACPTLRVGGRRGLGRVGIIERLTESAEHATEAARASLREAQLREDLANAYDELGHAAFTLLREGTLNDRRLEPPARRIRALESQLRSPRAAR